MTEQTQQRTPSAGRFILDLLGYVSLFVVPAVVLSLLFREYTPWIVVTTIGSALAISGFLVGLGWECPEWTDEAKSGALKVLFSIVHVPQQLPKRYSGGRRWLWYAVLCVCVMAGVAAHSLFWGKSIADLMAGHARDVLGPAATLCVFTLPAFFLGRAVCRWENRRSGRLK